MDARIEVALNLLTSARTYLDSLLEGLSDEDWFWVPEMANRTGAWEPYCSHVAWQVGHIAMAEYGLMLFRQRGRAEVDLELMPGSFRKRFAKGSSPSMDRSTYPEPNEIRGQLDRIHSQVLAEVPQFLAASLDEPLDPPTAGFPTKFGAMLMASQHEMLHCGQIGVLRRLMGKPPVR
ncbi:MAG: DinB family protein [Planctomycetaceae bacterium]|nr:DinB family protein [Planctomycetaceae bacterium]